MLHRFKLKINQSDDEENAQRISAPSLMPPPSSNSSISSIETDKLFIMTSSSNPTNDFVSNPGELKADIIVSKNPNIADAHTRDVAPASVSIISNNSSGGKRKPEGDPSMEHLGSVPSFVSIVSSQSQSQKAYKKPRTVSISTIPTNEPDGYSVLLSRPEDSIYLNPLHCFVRKNIECFVATAKDIAAPCPGRKNSVTLGQVGLRCIYCRNVYSRNRTKRAVCYPSSVSRVYHCVSDMKFDHFSTCKYLPTEERAIFNQLKASCTSKKRGKKVGLGSSNTARYYHESAAKLGMVDGPEKGIVTLSLPVRMMSNQEIVIPQVNLNLTPKANNNSSTPRKDPSPEPKVAAAAILPKPAPSTICIPMTLPQGVSHVGKGNDQESFQTRLLATPNDESTLAPVHCFVRKNVEIFAATADDVTAPAPGRKTRVTIGQIGIRCIHCINLPSKERVKRAICYPPTIASIYHSVSNMKFDHFGACRGIPMEIKQNFFSLQKLTRQKSGKNINRKTTAQYYIDSAIQDFHLVDTPTGVRFGSTYPQSASSSPTQSSLAMPIASTFSSETNVMDEEIRQSPSSGILMMAMAATDPAMLEAYEKRKLMSQNIQTFLPV